MAKCLRVILKVCTFVSENKEMRSFSKKIVPDAIHYIIINNIPLTKSKTVLRYEED